MALEVPMGLGWDPQWGEGHRMESLMMVGGSMDFGEPRDGVPNGTGKNRGLKKAWEEVPSGTGSIQREPLGAWRVMGWCPL